MNASFSRNRKFCVIRKWRSWQGPCHSSPWTDDLHLIFRKPVFLQNTIDFLFSFCARLSLYLTGHLHSSSGSISLPSKTWDLFLPQISSVASPYFHLRWSGLFYSLLKPDGSPPDQLPVERSSVHEGPWGSSVSSTSLSIWIRERMPIPIASQLSPRGIP